MSAPRLAAQSLCFGYHTSGLSDHDWRTALRMMAKVGYRSVALTVDTHCLNPFTAAGRAEAVELRPLLQETGLRCVIETGGRFLLDPWNKHQPTLLDPHTIRAQHRFDFLKTCCDIAEEVGATAVSFWAGALPQGGSPTNAREQLARSCERLIEHVRGTDVRLAFEPEPGMLIERCDQADDLLDRLDRAVFGLTIDVGHLYCNGELPVDAVLTKYAPRLFNIHLEDMRPGVHEHLRFGEGIVDFPLVLRTLAATGYTGGLHVELGRHSHLGPLVLQECYERLTAWAAAIDAAPSAPALS